MEESHLSVYVEKISQIHEALVCDVDRTEVPLARSTTAAFQVFAANLTALASLIISATLLLSFGNDRRDRNVAPARIDRDKGEIGGADVLAFILQEILHPDLDANLHGGIEHAVDGGAENHQIANVHRNQKVKMINGCGQSIVARVAMRSHGPGQVDPVHKASAKQCTERVSVVGQNNFRHLGLGIADGTG